MQWRCSRIRTQRTLSILLAAAMPSLCLSVITYGQVPTTSAAGQIQAAAAVHQEQNAAAASDQQDSQLGEAKSLLAQGMLNAADHAVRQYLATHPHSAHGHFLLGYILFREIQAKASLDDHGASAVYQAPVESVLKIRDANAKASLAEYTAGARYQRPNAFDLKIVALDYVLLGDFMDADKWLTRSLQWDPHDSQGWYYLGRAKYNENRFAGSVRAFDQCLRLDPKNVKAEDNLGLSYAGLGRNDDAIAAYQNAISWQAQSVAKEPEPFIDLGSLYLDLNEPEQAVRVLLQSLQISTHISRAHEQLGRAYMLLNQLPKAQSEMENAVALSPQTGRLHYILGQIYRKEGLTKKAKLEFDRCVALQGAHSSDRSTM